MMTKQEKLAMIEDVLELDEGTLEPEMELADIDEYNSMAKLSLIVMAEDEFGVKLSSEDIKGFVTVDDILAKLD